MKLVTHHESVLYNHHTQYTMLKQNAIDCNMVVGRETRVYRLGTGKI